MSAAAGWLPPAADRSLSGVLRVCGSPAMGELMAVWAQDFGRIHAGIHVRTDLRGTSTAQFGLQCGTAELALSGRAASTYEQYGIIRRSQLLPIEIPVAIGSHDRIGKSAALAVFVHRDNPVAGLSIAQLDGIFGAERSGGWGRIAWETGAARGPEGDIRRWGQLGLTGRWADAPIIPYAPPALHPGGVSFFQRRVLGGADTVNPRTREYPDRHAMIAALTQDRFGIAYAALGYAKDGVRAIPLSDGGPLIDLDRRTVADLSYPLSRFAYAYAAPDSPVGDPAPLNPAALAFLQFVLSRPGQQLVASTDYHPLPGSVADRHRARLTVPAEPIGAAP